MNPGKISENILIRSVLKNIHNRREITCGAAVGTDCAIFNSLMVAEGYVSGETVSDRDTVTPMAHAIYRAVNNIAAAGGIAEAIELVITLPESYREIKLKRLMQDADRLAGELSLSILGGHTETVAGIDAPIIAVTAIGHTISGYRQQKARPGQSIVMTKWMAISGSARLVREHRDEICLRLPTFILDDVEALEQFYSVVPEAAVAVKSGAAAMHDVSDGGIYAALWQLGKRDGVGLEVELKSIPVRQESIEVCEFYDINPYKLRSDGSLLIVTDDADGMIASLNAAGIAAVCIGHITEGQDRVITYGEDRRYLEEPRQDELHMV